MGYRAKIAFLSLLGAALSSCGRLPSTPEEAVARAARLSEKGDAGAALAVLEEYNQRLPGSPSVLEQLAFARAARQEHALAAGYFAEIARRDPLRSEYQLYAAQSLRQAGDTEAATRAIEQYLLRQPADFSVWKQLAEWREEQSRPIEAIDAYLRLHSLRPEPATALALGRLFAGLGNYPQADAWYREAAPDPGETGVGAWLGLLEIALADQRFADAERAVQELDRLHPGRLDASPLAQSRGELRAWRASQEEARRLAEELARQAEIQAEVDRLAAEDEAVANREAVADPAASPEPAVSGEPALEPANAPTDPLVLSDRLADEARQLRAGGRLTEARDRYRDSLREDDRSAATWFEYSEVCLALGDYPWAQAAALEATRRDPGSLRHTLQLLRVLQRLLPPEQLLIEMEAAQRKFPDSSDLTLALARAYAGVGQNPRAAAILYRRFLELAPGHPEADQARREALRFGVRP